MSRRKITKDTTILELFKMPNMYKKLMELGVPCVVCPIVGYEQAFLTLEMVARAYGLDLDRILDELNKALDESSEETNKEYNKNMVRVTHVHHATIFIEFDRLALVIDPFRLNKEIIESIRPEEVVVFFTHPHFDHFSKEDIELVTGKKKIIGVVVPHTMKDDLSGFNGSNTLLVEPEEEYTYTPGGISINIETVRAYNVNKINPETGKPYHPKENRWVGYVLRFSTPLEYSLESKFVAKKEDIDKVQSIYIAGDTDFIPEIQGLKDIDIAFLPVSGTYVMTHEEAKEAFLTISPSISVPIHYGVIVGSEEDAKAFVNSVKSA